MSLNSEQQIVGDSGFTEWAFNVTPQASGEQHLRLVATIRIKLPGAGEEVKDYPAIDRKISVKVDLWKAANDFAGRHWQWILGTILIPLGVAVWGHLRLKKNREV